MQLSLRQPLAPRRPTAQCLACQSSTLPATRLGCADLREGRRSSHSPTPRSYLGGSPARMAPSVQVRSTVIGDGQAGAQLACACWHGAHSIHRRRGSLPCLAERAQTRPRGAQHRPATAAGLVVSRQSPSLFKGRARHQALAQGDCQQEVRIIVAVAGSSDRVAHVRRGCLRLLVS